MRLTVVREPSLWVFTTMLTPSMGSSLTMPAGLMYFTSTTCLPASISSTAAHDRMARGWMV